MSTQEELSQPAEEKDKDVPPSLKRKQEDEEEPDASKRSKDVSSEGSVQCMCRLGTKFDSEISALLKKYSSECRFKIFNREGRKVFQLEWNCGMGPMMRQECLRIYEACVGECSI